MLPATSTCWVRTCSRSTTPRPRATSSPGQLARAGRDRDPRHRHWRLRCRVVRSTDSQPRSTRAAAARRRRPVRRRTRSYLVTVPDGIAPWVAGNWKFYANVIDVAGNQGQITADQNGSTEDLSLPLRDYTAVSAAARAWPQLRSPRSRCARRGRARWVRGEWLCSERERGTQPRRDGTVGRAPTGASASATVTRVKTKHPQALREKGTEADGPRADGALRQGRHGHRRAEGSRTRRQADPAPNARLPGGRWAQRHKPSSAPPRPTPTAATATA